MTGGFPEHLNNCIRDVTREHLHLRSTGWISYEERTVDAWVPNAEEGRGTLRKAPARGVRPQEPEMSEWGNPRGGQARASSGEHILWRGEPGELKHLSTRRKRNDSLSSGERKGRSLNRSACRPGLEGKAELCGTGLEGAWKARPETVTAR